jgi:hypothetical protein
MLFYRGMTCENVTIKGDKGTSIIQRQALCQEPRRPSCAGPCTVPSEAERLPADRSECTSGRPLLSKTAWPGTGKALSPISGTLQR